MLAKLFLKIFIKILCSFEGLNYSYLFTNNFLQTNLATKCTHGCIIIANKCLKSGNSILEYTQHNNFHLLYAFFSPPLLQFDFL